MRLTAIDAQVALHLYYRLADYATHGAAAPLKQGCLMNGNVFTYGSLMFDEVWRNVVAGHYRSEAATLHDYRRFAVPGVTYPGIVAMAGERIAGRLYLEVGPDDMARLDAFEGAEYRRDALPVALASGATVNAWTYVWLDHGRLSDAPWLSEAFRLREFLETYAPGTGESGG
jgi:gamma-glutamylcyclotransferase (GGCT)/AIG2-like uncharacterized protein YtfP